MPEKKERAKKYHVSTKDSKEPLVLLAADEKDAAEKWAKRTGKNKKDAVVTEIGTLAETITRQPAKDIAENSHEANKK